jgi:proteasome lid subunit RPN8/RPN11
MVVESCFVVRIPQAIYQEMVAHIVASYPDEGCGVVGCKVARVVKHYPTANAAEHPDDFSEIAEADLVRIFKDVDDYDGQMIYYHSHPQSEAYPSPRDIERAKNWHMYIIFSHRFYPEPPYVRIFAVDLQGNINEGEIELC